MGKRRQLDDEHDYDNEWEDVRVEDRHHDRDKNHRDRSRKHPRDDEEDK